MFSEELRLIAAGLNLLGRQNEQILNRLNGQALLNDFVLGALERSCPALVKPAPRIPESLQRTWSAAKQEGLVKAKSRKGRK